VHSSFRDAMEYLDWAQDHSLDLLILESSFNMGLTQALKTRGEPASLNQAYIWLSSHSDQPLQLECGSGPLGILVKPFSAKDLLGTLEIALYRADMEKKLANEERRYRELFDFSLSPRCLVDWEGRIVEANAAFGEIFKPQHEKPLILAFFTQESDWGNLRLNARMGKNVLGKEFDMRNSEGNPLKILASMARIDDPNFGWLLSLEFFDLTESQRLKEELLQSQKMDALGKLAGGIAHDFNNILTTIIGHSEMLRMDLASVHESKSDLEGIAAATSRATRLTRQLLGFSRKQPHRPCLVRLSALIKDSEGLLRKLAGESLLFSIHYPKEELSTLADPVQIEQTLMNLVTNARDALSGRPGGAIALLLGREKLPIAKTIRDTMLEPGHYATIAVADNGPGVPEAIADKIFDPFFTTKEIGQGTGLGLAIVSSIARAWGGAIELTGKEGKGSEFKLWLPLSEKNGAASGEEREPKAASPTPEELNLPEALSVLIVDDDEDLLGFLRYVVSKAGARAKTARNGGEALIEMERNPCQVLVVDMKLPGFGGLELYQRILNRNPDLKNRCVFISARPPDPDSIPEGCVFLEKPFSPYQLIHAISESTRSG